MTRLLLGLTLFFLPLPALWADNGTSQKEIRRLQETILLLQARLDDLRALRAQEVASLRNEKRQLQRELAHAEGKIRDLLLRTARTGEILVRADPKDSKMALRLHLARALAELEDVRSIEILLEISSDPLIGHKARKYLLELTGLECKRFGSNRILRDWWKQFESNKSWNRIRNPNPSQRPLDSPQNGR